MKYNGIVSGVALVLVLFATADVAGASTYYDPYQYSYGQVSYAGTPIIINQGGDIYGGIVSPSAGFTGLSYPGYNYAQPVNYGTTYGSSYGMNYGTSYGYPSSYGYPNSYGSYGSPTGSYYPYSLNYQNANSYPSTVYSSVPYDRSYASWSGYYNQYPRNMGYYTGNTDLFGSPLCNWGGGYNGYPCDSDPRQMVYDPYTSTWY